MNRKNNVRNVICIISVFLFWGCNNVKNENWIPYANFQYRKVKEELTPKKFFSHFPSYINSPFFFRMNTDDMSISYNYKLYNFSCKTDFLEQLMKKNSKKAIKRFLSTDSTMLVLKEGLSYQSIRDRIVQGDMLIPFFQKEDVIDEDVDLPDLFSMQTTCGLSPNFEIFIIDGGANYNPNITEKTNLFQQLPRSHNEAYSQGVCINLKSGYVIYWTLFF